MNTLFPVEPVFPPGFIYQTDFITNEEESELIGLCVELRPTPMNFHGFEAKRKVASFGYDYSFEKRALSRGKDIPPGFNFLIERVADTFNLKKASIGELLVTEYPPGSVINWHRDAPPFGLIIGISLLSDCIFRFRPYDKKLQGRKSTLSFDVNRRSMYLMEGESRSHWEHSISPVKEPRFSITLRTLKGDFV